MKASTKDNRLRLVNRMLALQDQVNSQINPTWRSAGNAWYRAIWVECAEMMDHVGWKWWKQQNINLPQAQLEVVDILHFGLSDLLQKHSSTIDAANVLVSSFPDTDSKLGLAKPQEIIENIEVFASNTLFAKKFDVNYFWLVSRSVGLDLEELGRQYVAKNVLNRFRQDHGYREGSYRKLWDGREDNDWLGHLSNDLDPMADSFMDELYKLLERQYSTVTKK